MAKSLIQKQEINPLVVAELEKAFILRNREKVLGFIQNNPFLVPLLMEAHSKIEFYFPASQLFLEASPEAEMLTMDKSSLTIFIDSGLTAKEALEKLDQFDEEWWGDVLSTTQGKLSVNLEFR